MEVDHVEPDLRRDMSAPGDESNSLASLLGGQSSARLSTQPIIPVTVEWAEKSKTKDRATSQKDEVEEIVQEILKPTKGDMTGTPVHSTENNNNPLITEVKTTLQFSKVCRAFLDKCRSRTAVDSLSKTSSASLILNSVAERNAGEKQKPFWPKKSLLRIIEECSVAASSCLSFVLLAIEVKDVDIVKCCIDHMQDIPDSTLTKCLQFYIRHFQGVASEVQNSSETDSPSPSVACPVTSTCAQCVNKVLCCPFNDTFIIDNLRRFSFDEAMVLLRYLHFLLASTPASVQDDCIPTLNIVADWISALLDAHFTQLLLSHEARALLAELAQSVQVQESFYTELEAVKTILQSFQDSVSVPVKQVTGSYSIKVLSM